MDHRAARPTGSSSTETAVAPDATLRAGARRTATVLPRGSRTVTRADADADRAPRLATDTSTRATERPVPTSGVVTCTPQRGIRTGPVAVSQVCR